MRSRLAILSAALLVLLVVVATLPGRAESSLPPNPRNPKGNDRTLQVLRPVPPPVVEPGPSHTYDNTVASPINGDYACRGNNYIVRTFTVPDSFTVYGVNLGFNAAHEYRGDIRVKLQSPQGTEVVVIGEDGDNTAKNYDLMLDDSAFTPIDNAKDDNTAEPYYDRPAQPTNTLSAFSGQPSQGTWTLRICDSYPKDGHGTYNRSQLVLQSPPTSPALEASKKADKHVVAAGMTIAYEIAIHNAGLAAAEGVTLEDPVPGGSAYVEGSVSTVGSPPATFNETTNAIAWTGNVGAGASVTVSYQVTVDPGAEQVENTATVSHSSLSWPLEPSVISDAFAGQDYLYTNETDYAIPDNGCASPTEVPLIVDQSFPVTDVQVGLNVSHTYRGEIKARLRSPLNTEVQLIASDSAVSHDNYDLRLQSVATAPVDDGNPDDIDAPFYDRTAAPAAPLGVFAGQNPQGTWTLVICDSGEQDVGTLNHWSLFFYTTQVPMAPEVTITPAVLLDWDPVTDLGGNPIAIEWYQIWRDGMPYFGPDETPDWQTPGSQTSHLDETASSEPGTSYFYVVRALSAGGVPSDHSNRTGKFAFGLTKGSG